MLRWDTDSTAIHTLQYPPESLLSDYAQCDDEMQSCFRSLGQQVIGRWGDAEAGATRGHASQIWDAPLLKFKSLLRGLTTHCITFCVSLKSLQQVQRHTQHSWWTSCLCPPCLFNVTGLFRNPSVQKTATKINHCPLYSSQNSTD